MHNLSKHIKELISISDEHLDEILGKFNEKVFQKREHILQQDAKVDEVYFIMSGCVRTYVYDLNGEEHNITFSMENWWFGDLQSFIKRNTGVYNIQALEETKVLSINNDNWNLLLQEVPAFVNYTRILFRNTMFTQENRILQNLSYTAAERYDFFLKKYPNLSQRISQKHIASYLGITPEFLSMIRRNKKD
ncbi:Crp/Fnr family transcriptional regulator [Flammeovirga sp. EKP202]|uniref:Crp/Fnr family transcriptional regulator n=1 Tax=Flammeovirga sp. EKP202 TaxID=2770592 RepID=UPI00165ED61A|nr:Crp/Fnr family transcriptional regulator [Flammeovirga sp. EKP202]MBD0401191.1 Crp/Fnr family transcriptional regulator [Flammeovirga sp. EKP202]